MTPQKQYLLDILDSLEPFESVIITADASGKPERFIVQRSRKIMVSEIEIRAVK